MDGQVTFAAGAGLLHDAGKGSGPPVIEIPSSNLHAREAVRQHACRSPAAAGSVGGLGSDGDGLAINGLLCKARAAG